MTLKNLPGLKIGNSKINIPIIQGGMGIGVSLSGLASAVASAGGVGIISTAGIGMFESGFSKHFKEANQIALKKEIKKARAATKGVIGVNVLMALSDSFELAMTAFKEGIDLIFIGAGLPLREFKGLSSDFLQKFSQKLVPIVSSARAANIIFRYWSKNYNCIPAAVVVEGPMAGGHLGLKKEQLEDPDYSLEKLLKDVVPVIKKYEENFKKNIPVIAAGGIYTGKDIYKFLKLGAQAVQMATRFVATNECDASIEFKKKYIDCKKEDLIIIDSPVGLPGRAIENKYLKDVHAGVKKPFKCPWKCLRTCDLKNSPYCIAIALKNAQTGKLNKGFAFAGANAYRIDKIMPVEELVNTLVKEYEEEAEKHK